MSWYYIKIVLFFVFKLATNAWIPHNPDHMCIVQVTPHVHVHHFVQTNRWREYTQEIKSTLFSSTFF